MISPCPRCGETRTDRVRHGAIYKLVWVFGYRLHRCSRCRAPRFVPRLYGKSLGSLQLGKEPASAPGFVEERGGLKTAEGTPEPKKDQVTAADSSDGELPRCSACGSTEWHRTKRTKLERLWLRVPMARCERCGMRFPYPGHREEYREPLKLAGATATVSGSAEEKNTPKVAERTTQARVTEQVASADSSDRGAGGCPACGSTEYHRTKRTPLERIEFRPAMARCDKCGIRFPYPRHHDTPFDSVKSGEAAVSVSHVVEGGNASSAAEEDSQPKVDKQGTAADSSKRELSRCPACGSTSYRRSRRTTLEHLLFRPKMARCKDCRRRFPYPKR
jgi:hypothetical protein